MAGEDGDGARSRVPNVKSANKAVDASSCDNGISVFVPIVSQTLGRWYCHGCWCSHADFGRGVDRYRLYEVVRRGCWSSEVEDAEVAVGADAREDAGRVW